MNNNYKFNDEQNGVICKVDIFEWLSKGKRFSTSTMEFETIYIAEDEDFIIAKKSIEDAIDKVVFNKDVDVDIDEEGNINIVEDFYKDGKIILISNKFISVYK